MLERKRRKRYGVSPARLCDKTETTSRVNKRGPASLTMWDTCSTHNGCDRKHAVTAQMEHVWMKVDREKRMLGEDTNGQGQFEMYILQEEEAQKMATITQNMAKYFDLS